MVGALCSHFFLLPDADERKCLYLGFPLAQAERRLAEGDGGTVRPARRLGGDVVVVRAPAQPAAVAVPVTNPTRESADRQKEGHQVVGKDGACRSPEEKSLEESNFRTITRKPNEQTG